jgi:transposase
MRSVTTECVLRVAATVSLTKKDKQALERYVKSRSTPVRLVERSHIVLLASQGLTNKEIAARLDTDENKVGRWRNRYIDDGLDGLIKEKPRGGNHGGKDTSEQAALHQKIIDTTTQCLPLDATHWSTRSLADALGTTHTLVHRIWKANGLKPHLIKTYKVSNDPRFSEKLQDVVGLYLSPPENAAVFCFDEKTSIQALDRTQPGLPIKKGRADTVTHDYKRHGTTTLFAAMEVASGHVIGETYRRHRHTEVLSFLKKIDKAVPKDQEIHIILDNYATHKHEKVMAWIEKSQRIYLHFTPTSSSWLNLVERFFALLTEKQLRRGVHTSVAELEQCLKDFIEHHNIQPTPFQWTKSAQEILTKVDRAKKRLDNL